MDPSIPVSHPAFGTRPHSGTGFSPASSPMAPCCVSNQSGLPCCNNCGRCTKGHNSWWRVKGLGVVYLQQQGIHATTLCIMAFAISCCGITTQLIMSWGGLIFAGYVTCCLSELSGFPYPVFPAKKDDIAPTVRLQLPTCFATPKYAGRLFWISSIYLIRAFVWGKKFHPTIWD